MTDLERYLREMVAPVVDDFTAHPTSRTHAFVACVVTYHAIDYLAYPRAARTLRQKFGRESKDFALVDELAHAFKHVVTDGRTPMNAGQVIYRAPGAAGVAMVGLSRVGDVIGGVTLADRPEVDVLDTVQRAVKFLWSKTGALVKG